MAAKPCGPAGATGVIAYVRNAPDQISRGIEELDEAKTTDSAIDRTRGRDPSMLTADDAAAADKSC